jgi:hypothetical protein
MGCRARHSVLQRTLPDLSTHAPSQLLHCLHILRPSWPGKPALWPPPPLQIKPGEREEIGKRATARAQKVGSVMHICLICLFIGILPVQAYAPTKSKVQAFLAMEANSGQVCPPCDDKDYSDMRALACASTSNQLICYADFWQVPIGLVG